MHAFRFHRAPVACAPTGPNQLQNLSRVLTNHTKSVIVSVAIVFGRTFLQHLSSRRTSSMTSLHRPPLACLLGIVISIGHVPAWLHLANCGGELRTSQDLVVEQSDSAVSNCGHDCHLHDAPATGSGESHSSGSGGPHQHDSDRCVVCHSLANPTGVVWALEDNVPSYPLAQRANPVARVSAATPALSIPHPRGPPAMPA
jgi:hypothetical protein